MSKIQLEIPESLQGYIDQQVSEGGYANAGDFIVAALHHAAKQNCQLESALIAGLRSGPAEPWTSQDTQTLQDRLQPQTTDP